MNKKIPQCKQCIMFDRENTICRVTFIMAGEDYVLTTKADDECHLIKNNIIDEVQSAGYWSDGKDGYVETPKLPNEG